MNLITHQLTIIDSENLTASIIDALCDFGTPQNPREPTTDEKWSALKKASKYLLEDCNDTQLPDSGLSILKRIEWQQYRDSLRSIQDDFDNPYDVIFPTPPEEE